MAQTPAAPASAATEPDQSTDARFLAGLRQRRLLALAETYCRGQLQQPGLSEARQADLLIELSRCLTERAVSAGPEQRQPLWQQAWQVTEDFARVHPASPRLPLVRLQGALALLARGELACREAQVVRSGRALVEEARTHLQAATQQLRQLAGEVEEALRQPNLPGRPGTSRDLPGRLSDDQLLRLHKHVQLHLARAIRNQAECFPPESPDRAQLLAQAVELLDPLARLDWADSLVWDSRIERIVCHRLLADYATARRELDVLSQQKPPPEVALRGRAEGLRLALAAHQLPEAIAAIAAGRELEGAVSADLDYARLETYLALWWAADQGKDPQQAAQWKAKAIDALGLIQGVHEPYWAHRAQMLLAAYVQAWPDANDLALVVRAAEGSYRSGRYDDALAGYDRARAMAEKQGDRGQAFELGYVAATIQHRRTRHEEALSRFRQTALAMPSHALAPEAHQLAIYHAAQLAKEQTPDSLDRYAAMLREYLQTWTATAGANKVRWQLGRLCQLRRDWPNAIGAYQAVSPEDPQFAEAVEAAGECFRAWLAERKAAGEPTEPAAAAAGWFESLLLGPQGRLPAVWSPAAQQAALAAARIRMDYTPGGYQRAEPVLSAALAGAAGAPGPWKSAAQTLLVFSLAGQGRRREAGEVLARISTGPTDQLLGLLEGLGRVADGAPPEVRTELAEMQIRAINLLEPRRGELDQSAQRSLGQARARALADSGRIREALAAYESLCKEYPRDGQIQESHAQLLSTRSDPASLQAALAKWLEVLQRSEPASDRWFRAEYSLALLNYRLGNKPQAVRIITRLKVLYPEMGGPAMKAQLLELLDRCRQ